MIHSKLYYNNYGIRVDDIDYNPGDLLPVSRVWVDNEITSDFIDGTSAIDAKLNLIKIRALIKTYSGKNVYIVKGDISDDYPNDDGEIILKNCIVVKKINKIKKN